MVRLIAVTFIFVFSSTFIVEAQEEEKKKKFGIGKNKEKNQDDDGEKKEKKMFRLGVGDKIGKLAGKLMTKSTDDLSKASASARYVVDMYTENASLSSDSFMPEGWKEGDDMVAINFLNMDGLGMLSIDGEVTYDGKPMEYSSMGVYVAIVDDNPKPKEILVKTTSGDRAFFVVEPTAPIKILSVNGQTDNVKIDLGEDLEIDIENGEGHEGTLVKVAMLTDVMGARAWNYFAEFRSKDKVIIPEQAFSNLEISGSVNGVGHLKQGSSYLLIERYVVTETDGQDLASAEIYSHSYSSIPITVDGKPDTKNYGDITAKGKYQAVNGEMQYNASKPNARFGIPFPQGSKFGLASLSVRGTLFHQETNTSESDYGSFKVVTTTTTTQQFPQLPDVFWEQLMENIYQDVVAFFKEDYGIDFVNVEAVTSSPHYENFYEADQENTNVHIKKSYKNTKNLLPSSAGAILSSISSNTTSDKPTINLMRDSETDGLVSITVDLQIASNSDDNIVLVPRMNMSIIGREEKYTNVEGRYCNVQVQAFDGMPFSESEFDDINALNRITRKDEMMSALRHSVSELRKEEVERGYDKIWALKE
ncbi:MAG: hypothetical protein RJQ09_04500 [Cyclobacteriaceae bacterium]